jgi:predicted nucleotidyltransferase
MIKKSIKEKIKDYFFQNPTAKLRVRHIERKVRVPLPSAIKYSKELVKEGILKKEVVANVVLYSANRNSERYKFDKKRYNVVLVQGLVEFLKEKYHNPVIIVFGSYSKGEDVEESDIDIYIESPRKKVEDVSKFENSRNIQLFVHKGIHEIKNKELQNNIINGVILNGFIEVFK